MCSILLLLINVIDDSFAVAAYFVVIMWAWGSGRVFSFWFCCCDALPLITSPIKLIASVVFLLNSNSVIIAKMAKMAKATIIPILIIIDMILLFFALVYLSYCKIDYGKRQPDLQWETLSLITLVRNFCQ